VEQKFRRIRKTAIKPVEEAGEKKKSLGGFLSRNEPTTPLKMGGSASVAGDQIAVSKESSLTGEVYVRADGKKGENLFSIRSLKHAFLSTSTHLLVFDSATGEETCSCWCVCFRLFVCRAQ
jgi:hypothetical protein